MDLIIKLILCVCLPFLAVALHRKPCAAEVLVNVLLWLLLCHVGGVCHALWVVLCEEDTRGWSLDATA